MADETKPPTYVLLSHSQVSSGPATLIHPVIQYQYADDSPLNILPTHPDEHVLVLNHDPAIPEPFVQSISNSLVVTSVKVDEAPGAAADDPHNLRNNSMFVIETASSDQYVVL